MEKHAYLVMAHNQWELLKILLECIDDERNDIYLHIDKKVNDYHFSELTAICKSSRLIFTKRFDIRWGGTEMMACEIQMIETALSNGNYTYIHLISGVDMPIKNQDYIHEYLLEHDKTEYIGFDWKNIEKNTFEYRSKYYLFFTKWIGRNDNKNNLQRFFKKVNTLSLAFQRFIKIDRLKGEKYYKGSQWFTITNEFAEYIIQNKRKILKRYRYTLSPDEAFLQNLIEESPEGLFRLAPDNKRFILWNQGEASPITLAIDYYDDMMKSEAFFARKFDWNVDNEVILKLKNSITWQ